MTEALNKIRKAFQLALDDGTPEQERAAAWSAALRLCLAQGWKTFDQVLGAFGQPVASEEPPWSGEEHASKTFYKQTGDEPYGWDQVMPFGKHSGLTLGQIAKEDPGYIEWLAGTQLRSTQLRRAVNSVYEWLESQ